MHPHKTDGYASVTVSLKPVGGLAGDATDAQMMTVAHLAETYAYDDIRVSRAQNLVLPHVALDDLAAHRVAAHVQRVVRRVEREV